jgi:protoheme IX farnesyltransferase
MKTAMEAPPTARSMPRPKWRDVLALTKPRISVLSVATAAAGLALSPGSASGRLWAWALVGTLLLVGSASTLNMFLERDVDGKMRRTKGRPLPAGRLSPRLALGFGLVQAAIAIPMLTLGANALTGVLGAVSLGLYVLVYTPLKRVTTWSLIIGAVPGAAPPVLGFTAQSGTITLPALALFGVLFFWQVPHFLAIALFRGDEYAAAGLRTMPAERGEAATKRALFGYLVAQVVATFVLAAVGIGGLAYLIGAAVLGAAMLALAVAGFGRAAGPAWARRFFFATVVYLPLLFALLLVP